ncbi:MAG: HAD family phosphatase [Planctomycetales bacterium]|nr:HAD family phosphatase [Planctomycetales bacterium]
MDRFVYFDLGNVLVSFEHQQAVQQLARCAGRPEELVRQVVFDSQLQSRYETGLLSCQDFAAEINLGLGCDLPMAEILVAISDIFAPNPSIEPVLHRIQREGVRMGILSNTCLAHWRWIAAQRWSMLGDWFCSEVLSFEVQCMKPDERIYQVCEQQSGCHGSSIFFTDDRAENIAAAAARGWTTHHFQSAEGLLQRLDHWLDKAGSSPPVSMDS